MKKEDMKVYGKMKMAPEFQWNNLHLIIIITRISSIVIYRMLIRNSSLRLALLKNLGK